VGDKLPTTKKELESSIIPLETNITPEWLFDPSKTPKGQIARDMVARNFWKQLDEMADAAARKEISPLDDVFEYVKAEKRNELIALVKRDDYVRSKMLAGAAESAFVISTRIQEAMEPVQVHLVMYLKENGLLPFLEIDTITEFLETKKSDWDGVGKRPGNHSEISFMCDWLIPVMEANGFQRERMLDISVNFAKSRYAIPQLRELLQDNMTKQKEIEKAIKECKDPEERLHLEEAMEDVLVLTPGLKDTLTLFFDEMAKPASQGLSRKNFQEALRKATRTAPEPEKALGYQYNLKNGGVIMISCTDTKMMTAIGNALSSLVEMHFGEPMELATQAAQMMMDELGEDAELLFKNK